MTEKEDLAKYLSSGFDSLEDWWAKICSFGACRGWLFEVSVIPASSFSEQEKLNINIKSKIGASKKFKCSDRDLNPSLWLSLFRHRRAPKI